MTILDRLLDELRTAKGPVSVSALGRRLDMAESAVDGMVSMLVATGRLEGDEAPGAETVACSGLACGISCVGLDDCAFTVQVPQTHRLVISSAAARQ